MRSYALWHVILKDTFLWNVVLDHQYRAIGSHGIPAVEQDVICEEIVIVVLLKAQAELGHACPVDGRVRRGCEIRGIPAACQRIVREEADTGLARSSLEVCDLKSDIVTKGAAADIDRDLAMRGERVCPKYTVPSDLQDHSGN